METEDIIRLVDMKLEAFPRTYATAAEFLEGRNFKMTGAYVTEAIIGAAREGLQQGGISQELVLQHLEMQQASTQKRDKVGF